MELRVEITKSVCIFVVVFVGLRVQIVECSVMQILFIVLRTIFQDKKQKSTSHDVTIILYDETMTTFTG